MNAAEDQMPFAISRALNDASTETREALVDMWPQHVDARSSGFIRTALQTEFSDKANLKGEIYDALGRGNLVLHADGGTKETRGTIIPVPTKSVMIGSHSVVPGQRPRELAAKVVKGNAIYQRVGRKLKLMYVLAKSVKHPKDVPFREVFAQQMQANASKTFKERMMQAMRTRR
jgi:hypothetical protein